MPTRIEALVVRVKVEDVPQRRGLKQASLGKVLDIWTRDKEEDA